MSEKMARRDFLRKSAIASTSAAAFGLSAQARSASEPTSETKGRPDAIVGAKGMPMGRIGNVEISRLICGSNPFGGGAHSRDLHYIRDLLRRYFTEERIMDTLELCEQNGISTLVEGGELIDKYRQKRGGKMQAITMIMLPYEDIMKATQMIDITRRALDAGAVGAFIRGCEADRWVQAGRMDLIEKFISFVKTQGVIAGVGAHDKEVPIACEKEGIDADFYFKTIHHDNYWSALPKEKRRPFLVDSWGEDDHDCIWAQYIEDTIEFMKTVDKPWIGFKVLAAGAIHPSSGFKFAFENGADFICVGMLDFQVTEDALIAKNIVADDAVKNRARPWRA